MIQACPVAVAHLHVAGLAVPLEPGMAGDGLKRVSETEAVMAQTAHTDHFANFAEFYPFYLERASQPGLPAAALCRLAGRDRLPGHGARHRRLAVAAAPRSLAVMACMDRPFLLREEPPGHLPASLLQPDGRLGDVQGYLHREDFPLVEGIRQFARCRARALTHALPRGGGIRHRSRRLMRHRRAPRLGLRPRRAARAEARTASSEASERSACRSAAPPASVAPSTRGRLQIQLIFELRAIDHEQVEELHHRHLRRVRQQQKMSGACRLPAGARSIRFPPSLSST